MKNNGPIFIVGTPRSGTTLLASMLSAHSRMACGPETHFFSKLTPQIEREIIKPKNWPDAAINYIASLEVNGEKVHRLFNISLNEIKQFLDECQPSISSALESLTHQFATKNMKKRWIEKTPMHLMYLASILSFFPNAKLIRIVRDPRDVALSLQKVAWG